MEIEIESSIVRSRVSVCLYSSLKRTLDISFFSLCRVHPLMSRRVIGRWWLVTLDVIWCTLARMNSGRHLQDQ